MATAYLSTIASCILTLSAEAAGCSDAGRSEHHVNSLRVHSLARCSDGLLHNREDLGITQARESSQSASILGRPSEGGSVGESSVANTTSESTVVRGLNVVPRRRTQVGSKIL